MFNLTSLILFFVTTLFGDLLEINPCVATYFQNQDVDYLNIYIPETLISWFTARNIRVNKAVMNIAKFSCRRIKVGLHYHIFTNKHPLHCTVAAKSQDKLALLGDLPGVRTPVCWFI